MAISRKDSAKKALYKRNIAATGYETKVKTVHPTQRNQKSKENAMRTAAEEPVASYTSRIHAIGNSKGVILNNKLIEDAGISPDADILVWAGNGIICIAQLKDSGVNTDLSTWDKQFKAAIKKGAKPERDLFDGIKNEFDEKEW